MLQFWTTRDVLFTDDLKERYRFSDVTLWSIGWLFADVQVVNIGKRILQSGVCNRGTDLGYNDTTRRSFPFSSRVPLISRTFLWWSCLRLCESLMPWLSNNSATMRPVFPGMYRICILMFRFSARPGPGRRIANGIPPSQFRVVSGRPPVETPHPWPISSSRVEKKKTWYVTLTVIVTEVCKTIQCDDDLFPVVVMPRLLRFHIAHHTVYNVITAHRLTSIKRDGWNASRVCL